MREADDDGDVARARFGRGTLVGLPSPAFLAVNAAEEGGAKAIVGVVGFEELVSPEAVSCSAKGR